MISEWFLIGGLIAITFCTFFNILTRNSEFGPIVAFSLSVIMTGLAWFVLSLF